MTVAFVYEEALSRHVLRKDHVLQPTRLQLTYELLEAYHAFRDGSEVVAPRMAEEAELLTFHTRDYIEAVKALSRGEGSVDAALYNFSAYGDNPPYEGMYEAAVLAVGASLVAAELLASGRVRVAFNVAGGLHHAAPHYASGFCIFNDPVIAIKHFLKQGMRVAYVDIDAHHGDGVQEAFYAIDQVLTISLHESGHYLFPGTGEVNEMGTGAGLGYAVNLPLPPDTGDEAYLWAFRQVVPPMVEHFCPDILVSQLGVDTHYLDPLTHLKLTTGGYTQVVTELKRLAERTKGWLALGGGGYDLGVVPRAWTLAYGVMLGRDWPDDIPLSYQDKYGLHYLRDREGPQIEAARRQKVQREVEQTVIEVKRLIFPIHGL